MKKFEAIVQPSKFDKVKKALNEIGIEGMIIYEVRGNGRQKGHQEIHRGAEYEVDFVPKVKIETIVDFILTDKVLETLRKPVYTGKIGDSKAFISSID